MIIDKILLNTVSDQAKASPRLRMNYNFHQSLDEKCHRFLNAVEPGTEVSIHRHRHTSETVVCLRGGLFGSSMMSWKGFALKGLSFRPMGRLWP